MYAHYWGMASLPFENRLDPLWYVGTPVHDEALARLFFLIEGRRRFGVLNGPTGCGKSLLLKVLIEQSRRSQREVAYVDLTGLDAAEMAWQLAAALRLAPASNDSPAVLWMKVNDYLAGQDATSGQTVLAFDHVESAETPCLRQLERLIHRDAGSFVQSTTVVAAASGDLTPTWPTVRKMVDLWINVGPLSRHQSADYIMGRLHKSDGDETIFDMDALDDIFEAAEGVPRDINRLCELSLLAAMSQGRQSVGSDVVRSIARDACPEPTNTTSSNEQFAW